MRTNFLFSLPLLGLLAFTARAGDHRDCGSPQRVCKLECTTKTVEATCYGYECEDVCLPGPSRKCRKHSESVDQCNLLCRLHWTEWRPGSATAYRPKRLTKYVAKREVPWYKWVVVACQPGRVEDGDYFKPAPQQAKLGDQFDLTAKELRHLSSKSQQDNR